MQWYMYKNNIIIICTCTYSKWKLVFCFLSSTIDKAIKSTSSRRVWVIVIHSPPSGDRVLTTSSSSSSTILVTRTIATPWAALMMVAVSTVTVTWREKRGEGGRGRKENIGEREGGKKERRGGGREGGGRGDGGRERERERERDVIITTLTVF